MKNRMTQKCVTIVSPSKPTVQYIKELANSYLSTGENLKAFHTDIKRHQTK